MATFFRYFQNHPYPAVFLVILGTAGFASKAILIKLAYHASDIDSITLMSIRMLLSLPLFLAVSVWAAKNNNATPMTKKELIAVILLGFCGYYISSYLDFTGLKYISAGLERLILFLYPTFVVILSALIYRQKITARVIQALLLCYAGIVIVITQQFEISGSNILKGSLFVFASSVTFSIFVIGSERFVRHIGSVRFTAYSMTFASLFTLLHFVISHDLGLVNISMDVWKIALIMAIFATVLPAFLVNAGIKKLGASSASIIGISGPVITLFIAWLVLDESPGFIQLTGAVLVLSGVAIVSRNARK